MRSAGCCIWCLQLRKGLLSPRGSQTWFSPWTLGDIGRWFGSTAWGRGEYLTASVHCPDIHPPWICCLLRSLVCLLSGHTGYNVYLHGKGAINYRFRLLFLICPALLALRSPVQLPCHLLNFRWGSLSFTSSFPIIGATSFLGTAISGAPSAVPYCTFISCLPIFARCDFYF